MNKYRSEIFGEFTYAESMTYEDLIANESDLMENLDGIFQDGGAEHLDYTPLGDMLMTQCAFEVQNLEIFRDIAQEIAFILPEKIKGRLMCLQKDLTSYHLFWIRRGQWQEQEIILPIKGPENVPVHKIKKMPEPVQKQEEMPAVSDKPEMNMERINGADL